MDDTSRLSNVAFVSIAGTKQRQIGTFVLDPDIKLPVEMPPGSQAIDANELSWEAIVAGALKVLAWDASHPNVDYYRRFVLAVKPDIKQEFTHLGISKVRNGDAELAIEIFRALEALFPDDPASHLNLALAYEARARLHEKHDDQAAADEYMNLAFDSYKRALAVDPSQPVIHLNMAYFYLHQRSFEKAREHLLVFVNTADDEGRIAEARRIIREIDSQGLMDGLFQKAFDNIRMGKEREGIATIEKFLESRPDFQNAWFLLGWGHRRLGEYAEGKEAFLQALEAGSPHADLLNELAICLMELGELQESGKRLGEALRLDPDNTKVISNLGIVALKSGNQEEARAFFRTVLELDPQDAIAARYLQSLPENTEK